ncbi:VanZ family protein [Cryobacterium sp. TMT3-29-2]|nr:VanZ family protein [Cryobacterium sp. TMT3-29-2]
MTDSSRTPPQASSGPAAAGGAAHPRIRRSAPWLMLVYLIALAFIAFWPVPVDRDAHDSLLAVLDWLQVHGAPAWVGYRLVEFVANIALFVPVGLFVTIMTGARGWWLAVMVGFAASCTIELGQLIFNPDRFATVSDVIANTVGTAVGAALGLVLLRGGRAR